MEHLTHSRGHCASTPHPFQGVSEPPSSTPLPFLPPCLPSSVVPPSPQALWTATTLTSSCWWIHKTSFSQSFCSQISPGVNSAQSQGRLQRFQSVLGDLCSHILAWSCVWEQCVTRWAGRGEGPSSLPLAPLCGHPTSVAFVEQVCSYSPRLPSKCS